MRWRRKIRCVAVRHIGPDDTIMVSVDRRLTAQEADQIKQWAIRGFRTDRVVVLAAGVEVSVLRTDPAPEVSP
jgi:hypothetical protein